MINGKIVDTSLWIDYLNNIVDKKTDEVAELIQLNQIILLPVILQEVLQGIRIKRDFTQAKDAFIKYPFFDYNEIDMAIEAASLFRFLKEKGITVRKPNDCLISAICILNSIELLHNDKDFNNIAKHTSLKIYK